MNIKFQPSFVFSCVGQLKINKLDFLSFMQLFLNLEKLLLLLKYNGLFKYDPIIKSMNSDMH